MERLKEAISKATINLLINAYALKIFSAKEGAPFRVQQRFHDAFTNLHDKLQSQNPKIDMASPAFWDQLEARAKAHWKKQAIRGAGRHW